MGGFHQVESAIVMVKSPLLRTRCRYRAGLPLRVRHVLFGIVVCCVTSPGWIPASLGQGAPIEINLAENAHLNLEALVRLAADKLALKILYDESVLSQQRSRIVIRGQAQVTSETLLELLQATLRVHGLALVDADVGDFKRIVRLEHARPFVPQGTSADVGRAEYVTEIFQLRHVSVQIAEAYVRSFSTQGATGGSGASAASAHITTIPDARLLIVTDVASSMERIEGLIRRIDVPATRAVYRFRKVEHLEASELKRRLDEILSAGNLFGRPAVAASAARGTSGTPTGAPVQVLADERTNRLLLIGSQGEVDALMELVDQLDVALDVTMKIYRFEHISASRVDMLIQQFLGEDNVERAYQSVVDEETNRLIITTRPDIHQKIDEIRKELDVAPTAEDAHRTVRFYRLKNVNVRDILDSLRAIERTVDNRAGIRQGNLGRMNYREGFEPAGPNRFNPDQLEGPLPSPPAVREELPQGGAAAEPISPRADQASNGGRAGEVESVLPGRAKLTIEESTNTLIVVAEPAVQALYAEMIDKLDRLRPQVLIEAKIVAISGTDTLDLGVEISGGDRSGLKKLFAFTSYGLSTVDPATGALSLIPGLGFNGTLVDPSSADAILRALVTSDRARVVSSPRVLVKDNAIGTLTSVSEVPFVSVNASQTVATTSFAGFAEAGTTIRVTPHLSEGDHLRLEFDIIVNDFTGEPTETTPPPRQTNQVTSEVTIPDGHTVIVGGLRRHRLSHQERGLPLVAEIPLVKHLFGTTGKTWQAESLYVFIRPVILRDDKFRDLRYYSFRARSKAHVRHDFPESRPILIR